MKQANKLARRWIEPTYVGTLEAIAMDTGKREVLGIGSAAMLTGNDVIDLKWGGVYGSGQLTIFTSCVGAPPNSADELRSNARDYRAARCRARRALDCMVAMRFPTWM